MSKGNDYIKARVPADLMARVEADLAKREAGCPMVPWTMADWLRAAVEGHLRKRHSSRTWRPGRTWRGLRAAVAAARLVPDELMAGG